MVGSGIDAHLDGSALAGPLSEVFVMDITTAGSQCTACGLASMVAQLRVYASDVGYVARCPGCDNVMLRLVRTPTHVWLDVRGSVALRFPVA
jgi:hypothetical protein